MKLDRVVRIIELLRNNDDDDQLPVSFGLLHNRIRHPRLAEILVLHEDEATRAADQPEVALPDVVPPRALNLQSRSLNRNSSEHLKLLSVDVRLAIGFAG